MTRNEMIEDKIKGFFQLQRKVHLTKTPSIKYPRGKFYNGFISQYLQAKSKIIFLDDVEGPVEIFFFEIADLELYKEEGEDGFS